MILDFGSQYTQLIARRIRGLNVDCEIYPFNHLRAPDAVVKGVLLSGSPYSGSDDVAPVPDLSGIKGVVPLLGSVTVLSIRHIILEGRCFPQTLVSMAVQGSSSC